MAVVLGKRKRGSSKPLTARRIQEEEASSSSESDTVDLQAVFRKAFEAKFKPLPESRQRETRQSKPMEEELEGNDDDSEEEHDTSSWDGFSDTNDQPSQPAACEVEVISYTDSATTPFDATSKAEMKAFMSSRPPTAPKTSAKAANADDSSDDEATNLKNDLSLQRLLRESHLLSSNTSSNGLRDRSLTTTGAARHAALDLTMQALGAKDSTTKPKQKMPISHYRGIAAKKLATEEKRRREAKDMGIILEKQTRQKSSNVKRDRGVGAPTVGKFRRGTLQLSRNDIRSIHDDGERFAGGGSRGGRNGRGRGKRR